MSLLAVKLRRDVRASWPRFLLMVVALAVSLSVFGGMMVAYVTTGRETRAAYVGTEPASATLVLEPGLPVGEMARVAAEAREREGVLDATGRTQVMADVLVDGEPRGVQLQAFVAAPDDPMRMVKFDSRGERTTPPGPGELWLGDDGSLALLGAAIGDVVTIKWPDGEPVEVKVAGTTYDPSLAPSPQEQRGHGYLSTDSLVAAGRTPLLDQLKLQVSDPGQSEPSRDRERVVAVASDVARWLRSTYGVTLAEVQVPTPYAHPHQWQADVLLVSLLVGSGAALLLAAILVATMLNNLFTQQIPQIGILKAIGARSRRIGRAYLLLTLTVAAVATAIAVLPAVQLGSDRVEGFLGILGITTSNLAPDPWIYVVIVAIGLALPPLIALVPLVKASRTTVRKAIDHHGGSAKPSAASGVLAGLSRLRWFDRGLQLALRNTVRRPARFFLSVGLLAMAGMVFVAGMSLRSSTLALDEERTAARSWDVDVELADSTPAGTTEGALNGVPGIASVEAFARVGIGLADKSGLPVTRTYPDQGHGKVELTALSATGIGKPREVVEGRWLRPGETGAVVLDVSARNKSVPNLGAGDDVRVFVEGKATSWRIVGLVQEGEVGGGGAYATAEGLAAATGAAQGVNRLRIRTDVHDERTRRTVAADVEAALTRDGVAVASAASVSRSQTAGSAHLGPVLLVLLGVALPLGVLGGIGLATTMSANVLDRTREFGVMHAIGARPRAVRRIVVAEGVFLALTSCLLAALPAAGLTALLGNGLGNLFGNAALPFRISGLGVGIWLVFVVLGSVLATEAAAARASRITVREALSYL